jgi:hypothetical protein
MHVAPTGQGAPIAHLAAPPRPVAPTGKPAAPTVQAPRDSDGDHDGSKGRHVDVRA